MGKFKFELTLNMIVKDEAHIILSTLANVCKYFPIDSACIVDTGSTDGTQKLIKKFFSSGGPSGGPPKNSRGKAVRYCEVHERAWVKDFAFSRNQALDLAEAMGSKYVVVMDADDIIVGNFRVPDPLTEKAYSLKIGPGLIYYRNQIVRLGKGWRYVGALHEVLVNDMVYRPCEKIEGEYLLLSRRLGARSSDPLKYQRDAQILQGRVDSHEVRIMKALEGLGLVQNGTVPDVTSMRNEWIKLAHDYRKALVPKDHFYERDCFYLAQSYFDAKLFNHSELCYGVRSTLGGWWEEVYYSLYRLQEIVLERLMYRLDNGSDLLPAFAAAPKKEEDNSIKKEEDNSIKKEKDAKEAEKASPEERFRRLQEVENEMYRKYLVVQRGYSSRAEPTFLLVRFYQQQLYALSSFFASSSSSSAFSASSAFSTSQRQQEQQQKQKEYHQKSLLLYRKILFACESAVDLEYPENCSLFVLDPVYKWQLRDSYIVSSFKVGVTDAQLIRILLYCIVGTVQRWPDCMFSRDEKDGSEWQDEAGRREKYNQLKGWMQLALGRIYYQLPAAAKYRAVSLTSSLQRAEHFFGEYVEKVLLHTYVTKSLSKTIRVKDEKEKRTAWEQWTSEPDYINTRCACERYLANLLENAAARQSFFQMCAGNDQAAVFLEKNNDQAAEKQAAEKTAEAKETVTERLKQLAASLGIAVVEQNSVDERATSSSSSISSSSSSSNSNSTTTSSPFLQMQTRHLETLQQVGLAVDTLNKRLKDWEQLHATIQPRIVETIQMLKNQEQQQQQQQQQLRKENEKEKALTTEAKEAKEAKEKAAALVSQGRSMIDEVLCLLACFWHLHEQTREPLETLDRENAYFQSSASSSFSVGTWITTRIVRLMIYNGLVSSSLNFYKLSMQTQPGGPAIALKEQWACSPAASRPENRAAVEFFLASFSSSSSPNPFSPQHPAALQYNLSLLHRFHETVVSTVRNVSSSFSSPSPSPSSTFFSLLDVFSVGFYFSEKIMQLYQIRSEAELYFQRSAAEEQSWPAQFKQQYDFFFQQAMPMWANYGEVLRVYSSIFNAGLYPRLTLPPTLMDQARTAEVQLLGGGVRGERGKRDVFFSMTTCKRLNEFVVTMNSFLLHCPALDLARIAVMLIVDDNSSEEDRKQMQGRFPFCRFLWKTPDQKGHAKSMNLILQEIRNYNQAAAASFSTTESKKSEQQQQPIQYWMHMEDDFSYFKVRPYIRDAITILEAEPTMGQVLFNRQYIESPRIPDDVGVGTGLVDTVDRTAAAANKNPFADKEKIEYLRQIHVDMDAHRADFELVLSGFPMTRRTGRTHWYWPGFSFRPSVLRWSMIEEVGTFQDTPHHFEMEYAKRVRAKGWEVCFFNDFCCEHIGRLTRELSLPTDQRTKNAYDLNDTRQFA